MPVARPGGEDEEIDAARRFDPAVIGGGITRIGKPDLRLGDPERRRQAVIQHGDDVVTGEAAAGEVAFERDMIEARRRLNEVIVHHHDRHMAHILRLLPERVSHRLIDGLR